MPKVKRAKVDEDPKSSTITLTRARRTPKPNPKYLNDDIIASPLSPHSDHSLTGFDAHDYDSNEDEVISQKSEQTKFINKKRPVIRLDKITDVAKAMEMDEMSTNKKSKISEQTLLDEKKTKRKRTSKNAEDSDFVVTSSNDEDEDKFLTRARKNLRPKTKQEIKASPMLTQRISRNLTGTSTPIRTFSPKLKKVVSTTKSHNLDTNNDIMDIENSVPTFTIVNINDIIKRGPRRVRKKGNYKETTDEEEDDFDENDETSTDDKRITRRSAGDDSSNNTNNDNNNRNRRKTLHTTILKEDFEIKKGPGRPVKKLKEEKKTNHIRVVKTSINLNNNKKIINLENINDKIKNVTKDGKTLKLQQQSNTTPRILNSLFGRSDSSSTNNQNKIQMLSKSIEKPKIDLTTDDENIDDDIIEIGEIPEDDDDDDDDEDIKLKGSVMNKRKEELQQQLTKQILNKSKENHVKIYKNTGTPSSNSNNNNKNNLKQQFKDNNIINNKQLKLNREKTKLAALMESKPRVVISQRGGTRIKKITCFETWYIISIPNIEEPVQKSWVLINLIKLGNDIKNIKLPTNDWGYRITLAKIAKENSPKTKTTKIAALPTTTKKDEVYTGEIHDKSIKETEKHNYEPINIMFRRKSKNKQSSIEYDRSIIFKNRTYSLNIDGKNVKLIGAPQYIHNLNDIEILLDIINNITLINPYVEQNAFGF